MSMESLSIYLMLVIKEIDMKIKTNIKAAGEHGITIYIPYVGK